MCVPLCLVLGEQSIEGYKVRVDSNLFEVTYHYLLSNVVYYQYDIH